MVQEIPRTIFFRRCISASYYFCSASRFGKDLKDFEGGNIPPQRPSACSPRLKTGRAGRFARQTTSLSSSSTFFEGENISPQRSLRSLLPSKTSIAASLR